MIYELLKDRIMNGGSGSEAIIQSLSISANGTYTAPADIDGYSPITVNVPQKEPNIQNLSITTNGTYTAPTGTDGYSPVVVDVQPNLEDITITANGTYTHTGKDGYDQVIVNVPQQGLTELTVGGYSLQNLDYYNIWNSVIKQLTDIYFSSSYIDCEIRQAFSKSSDLYDLSHLTIHIEGKGIRDANGMFQNCENLRKLPILKTNEFNKLGDDYSSTNFNAMFSGCSALKEIPYNYLSQLHNLTWKAPSVGSCQGVFRGCSKLRALPDLKFMNNTKMGVSTNSSRGYVGSEDGLSNCFCLDEVTDLPLPANVGGANNDNMFGSYKLYRIKNFTFMKVDGQVQSRTSFHNQNINLQNCGYAPSGTNLDSYLNRWDNSAKVSTLEDYNRLKTDPDWWTDNADFSRYNYTSAKNTIESLPRDENDSDWGTLALKRYAGQGYGKCPNDLTNEELAVATRKGWTVALSTT